MLIKKHLSGTVVGAGDTEVYKTAMAPSHRTQSLMGKTDIK